MATSYGTEPLCSAICTTRYGPDALRAGAWGLPDGQADFLFTLTISYVNICNMNNPSKDHTRGHNPGAQSCYVHLAAGTAHAARPERIHPVVSWLLTLLLLAGISTNFST